MHITVFGASGKSGRHILSEALERGHTVTGFVRDPGLMELSHPNLELVQGDMFEPATLPSAFARQPDAVVLAVGVYHAKPATLLSEGTRNILQAANAAGVKRLLAISSLGVGDSAGQGNFFARMIQRFSLKHVLADKERQEALIRELDMDWTIVRPPRLVEGSVATTTPLTWVGPVPAGIRPSWKITRATLAQFLVGELEQPAWLHQAVLVSG